MPLKEISNSSQHRGEKGARNDLSHAKIKSKPLSLATEIVEETVSAPLTLLDFLHEDADAAANGVTSWICLLCNTHGAQTIDRDNHVYSAAHRNRETILRVPVGDILTFFTPQYHSKGCFKIGPYRWTTCRLSQSQTNMHPPRITQAVSTSSSKIQFSRSDKTNLFSGTKHEAPRKMARLEKTSRDMLFACISPSEANYSWSCSLCDIHGLKAQTFWLHCLGQQHTQASQSALEEQLAAELEAVAAEHSAQSKLEVKKEAINQKEKSIGAMREYVETESELVESLALELPVQQVNAKVSAFSTPSITPEPLCMVETATRGDVKAEPLLLKHSGDCELVKGEEVIVMKAMSETLSVAEQVAQEDVETLSQLVKPAGGEEPEALIVVVPGSMDNLEKPTLAEPFVKVSVEQVFVNDTVFITDVIMHKTKPDLVKLPKEDAMEEITLESIAPCSFTVNNISTKADHFERSAFATRNDDNEYWSCNLCGIYTLQAHSVKSHCLGKKHMKAFEIAHQPQIRLSPKQSTPSTEMKLKVKFAFDKSIQEAACVDKRFTFVSLVEAGSAWYCTLCKIKTLQVKDVKPHCLGKRHLTAYLAQVERPFRDNSEVRMEHDGLPLNEATEQEAISAIKKRLLEDISFTKLERRPSAVMMQEIIKEAESQDEGLWSSASDIDDKEKFIISEGGVVDVRLVESVLDSDFINQEDDDALLEFDSWAIDKPADPAADADCVVYVVYSERLQLSELVGDEFLDVFDISMDDFTDQLGEELDKLSEKVMEDHEGSDQESEGCDRLTPGSKARECVAALAFLGF